jgi:hypothetical protein
LDISNRDFISTKYWGTYHATNYPPSWTGDDWQFLTPNVWWKTSGYGQSAYADDTFALSSAAEYGPQRMLLGNPRHPARSIGDGGAWESLFTLAADEPPGAVDSVAAGFNVKEMSVDFKDLPDSGWPGTGVALSAVKQALTSGSYTVSGFRLTRTDGGTWPPHAFEDPGHGQAYGLHFGTSGAVFKVKDNTRTTLLLAATVAGQAGTASLLAPQTHGTFTGGEAGFQLMRPHFASQESPANAYQAAWLVVGMGYTMHAYAGVPGDGDRDANIVEDLEDGRRITSNRGPNRREWELAIPPPKSEADWLELKAVVRACKGRPFAFIWDASDSHACALVELDGPVNWNHGGLSTLRLREVR